MIDIRNYDTFIKIEPIHKGWSNDKKYYVETMLGWFDNFNNLIPSWYLN